MRRKKSPKNDLKKLNPKEIEQGISFFSLKDVCEKLSSSCGKCIGTRMTNCFQLTILPTFLSETVPISSRTCSTTENKKNKVHKTTLDQDVTGSLFLWRIQNPGAVPW